MLIKVGSGSGRPRPAGRGKVWYARGGNMDSKRVEPNLSMAFDLLRNGPKSRALGHFRVFRKPAGGGSDLAEMVEIVDTAEIAKIAKREKCDKCKT